MDNQARPEGDGHTAAVSLCNDNNMPMIIFSMREAGNIVRVVQGEKLGSLVIP